MQAPAFMSTPSPPPPPQAGEGAGRVCRERPAQHVASMRTVDPPALKSMLTDGGELALVDVREELIFSQRHLLWARSIPLSRLELNFARLVPRLSTRIVLCDADDVLAVRAGKILSTGDRKSTRLNSSHLGIS